ncbi:secretin N-terminal domain-containing protein [Sulfurimonas microaerophilic]|uniref:secretin N-terminal domain-containing protein n=1 Tax=Sulfurimonas microaerophilic TaxID=3058392 RepID=UPI002714BB52|nr:secretin N-terminal domain-containing protein [Sulfurimonas sp. hsl 1-7]
MKFVRVFLITLFLLTSLSAREKVNVNFSNVKIDDFIELVSKITHKNILVTQKVNGTVNFISSTPIYDDELIELLVDVLESKGFTLVQKGSRYEVIRATDAANNNLPVIAKNKKLYGATMVTQALEIKGENVDVVAAKVRYLISKTAKLMTMKESNTLLVTDYPKNIETLKKVIKDLSNNVENVVKIIYLKNTEAKKLNSKITEIQKSIFNQQVVSEQVTIVVDENVNGLVLVGDENNVNKLAEIVAKLDVESNINNTVKIFALKNSDAQAVLKTITDIIAKQTFKDPAMKPNVSASDEINSIVVIGDPLVIKGIQKIIEELDKEKFQVYVQAKIVEINKNKSQDIGVKYGFSAGDISSSGLYAMSANFGSADLTTQATAVVGESLGTSVIGVTRSALALGATLDFLQQNGAGQSISNPSILCVNNKESSIYVGKTISISTGSVTTSAGIGGTTSSYKREDVGLTLKIKPRVSSNDKVTLDVEAVLENVLDDGLDASGQTVRQPVTSKQEVKTQAILRHGESIIIGGLVKTYSDKTVTKVPLLGDIPLIGKLFTSTSDTEEEDNLVVILTPYVIDKSEELSQLQKDLGVLSKIQEKYNKDIFKMVEEGKDVKH